MKEILKSAEEYWEEACEAPGAELLESDKEIALEAI